MVEDAIETIENVIAEIELGQMLGVIAVIVFLKDVLVQLVQSQRRLKTRILMAVVRLLALINIRFLLPGREMARTNCEMGVILLCVERGDQGRVHPITRRNNHMTVQVVRMVRMHLVMQMVWLGLLPEKLGLPPLRVRRDVSFSAPSSLSGS